MNRAEALLEWKEKVVIPGYETVRKEFFERVADHQELLHQIFFHAIGKIGKKKEEITYLHFQVPRTGIQSETYPLYLFAYNSLWFLDLEPAMETIDFSYFFEVLSARKKELDEKRKIYMGKVTKYDVYEVMYEECFRCTEELSIVLREWFWNLEEEEWVSDYPFGLQYQIRLGGYQEDGEILFAMDNRKKDTNHLIQFMKEEHSFFYTVWKGANLQGVKLSGEELFFVNMKESKLLEMDFSHCCLQQAGFWKSDVTGCDFTKAACQYAKFKGAKLTGCSFREADLTGADFRNTTLEQVDFTDAVLEGSSFMEDQVPFLHLSPIQLQGIVIETKERGVGEV